MTDAGAVTRVLVPHWHAAEIGEPCRSIDDELAERHGRTVLRLAARFPFVLGFLIFRAARDFDRVGVVLKAPGALVFTLLEAWVARRHDRLVLLTFLPREPSHRPFVDLALRIRFAIIERPSIRRAMRAGHVLTRAEQTRYAERYRIPPERFHHIPWAYSAGSTPAAKQDGGVGVVSSGRAFCDWETLFAAASRALWPLTVICSERDAPRIHELNEDGRARVLVEIPDAEHNRLLREAAIYAMCLRDEGPSAGHVRLLAAVDAGVSVVASDVPGLVGYIEPGETAIMVPPGDPDRLEAAISSLMTDPSLREKLAARASARAAAWTYRDFWGALRDLLVAE